MNTIVTPRNFKFNIELHGRNIKGESLTIPDQSFTIQDILSKFTRGIDPMVTKNPVDIGDEEPEFDDIPGNFNPDLTDVDEAKAFVDFVEGEKKKGKKKQRREEIQPIAQDTIK